jgi:hypothetical protein
MSFSGRVLHMDPCPCPLRSELADATGYPRSPRMRCGPPAHLVCPVIVVRALACPFSRGLTGNHRQVRTEFH